MSVDKPEEAAATVKISNPWEALRQKTAARIGLARIGASQSTRDVLQFSLDHARARDAVGQTLDEKPLADALRANGFRWVSVASAAASRAEYLLRPDLGRQLNAVSREALAASADSPAQTQSVRLSVVIADGLSAQAVQTQSIDLLNKLRGELPPTWGFTPVAIASQARVALGDEVGAALAADLVVVLIGERPGLSSPDSMGIYLSFAPAVGLPDSRRNCISNVRRAGLPVAAAAARLSWMLQAAVRMQTSGVALKDRSDIALVDHLQPGALSE